MSGNDIQTREARYSANFRLIHPGLKTPIQFTVRADEFGEHVDQLDTYIDL